ncbi:MAG: hypothetical protein KAW09_00640 [Thermoplasmata archaeon]|nr:hypothetical protein [Thermoplasmata archaeon]
MSRKRSERTSERTRSKIPFDILPLIPPLVFKGGMAYLKFKHERKKGVKAFRKELRASGMTEDQMEELIKQYEDIGRLRSYLGDFSFFRSFV